MYKIIFQAGVLKSFENQRPLRSAKTHLLILTLCLNFKKLFFIPSILLHFPVFSVIICSQNFVINWKLTFWKTVERFRTVQIHLRGNSRVNVGLW